MCLCAYAHNGDEKNGLWSGGLEKEKKEYVLSHRCAGMDEVRIFAGVGRQKSNRIAANCTILDADGTGASTVPSTSASANSSSYS